MLIVVNIPEELIIMSMSSSLINRTIMVLWVLAAFGICHFYFKTLKYTPREITLHLDHIHSTMLPLSLDIHRDEIFLAIEAWQNALRKLKKGWKVARLGCALIFPYVCYNFLLLTSCLRPYNGKSCYCIVTDRLHPE